MTEITQWKHQRAWDITPGQNQIWVVKEDRLRCGNQGNLCEVQSLQIFKFSKAYLINTYILWVLPLLSFTVKGWKKFTSGSYHFREISLLHINWGNLFWLMIVHVYSSLFILTFTDFLRVCREKLYFSESHHVLK